MASFETQQIGSGFVEALIGHNRLRAGGFIVTLYGDVVEPRGGHLWIGHLIEACAWVGLSETLVRTAVSRLVAAHRLHGVREGRRSYYKLSDTAKAEFLVAARRVFEPAADQGWTFVWTEGEEHASAFNDLETAGFKRLTSGWWLGPKAHLPASMNRLIFEADTHSMRPLLQSMAARHWDMLVLMQDYDAFLHCFLPVMDHIAGGAVISPRSMLQIRLLMVHQFRQIALRDPDLPQAALPDDWAGYRARALFAKLYLALSPAADAYVSQHFVSSQGHLPARSPDIIRRLQVLETQIR